MPTTVSIIGTIAARYDMPIGVEGDAGRVAAIYVEAGDHVKRGQVLARLNVSVLEPQVANLEAALEQARAEAELADAEYRRAQAVGASGALSAEETQRRKSSRVTAAAKVKVAAAQLAEAQARLARADSARAGRRHHFDPQRRGGANRDAGRRGLVPPVGRRRSRTARPGCRAGFAPAARSARPVNVRLTGTTRVYPGPRPSAAAPSSIRRLAWGWRGLR